MSQTGVFVYINSNLVDEVFTSIPDHEELIQICIDEGYVSSDRYYPEDYLLIEYEKVEIGSGESGSDLSWDDPTMIYLYQNRNLPDCPEEVYTVEEGRDEVTYDEIAEVSGNELSEEETPEEEDEIKLRPHL